MADFLLGKSKEDISWTDLKEGVVNSITAISNIMDSASYNADFSRNDLTQEADRNKVSFLKAKIARIKLTQGRVNFLHLIGGHWKNFYTSDFS